MLALVFLSSVSGLIALPADLQSELSAKYEKQVLMLRHPVQSNSMKYDADGNLIGRAEPGAWTVFGGIEITKVRISGDKLRLDGTRLIFRYDPKMKTMQPFRIKDRPRAKLEIALNAPLASAANADTTINRIFTRNDDELIDSVPDYWRPFLQKVHSKADKADDPGLAQQNVDIPMAKEVAARQAGEPLKIDGKLVKPPHARYTPEPSYEEFARKIRLQGTVVLHIVVDREGDVHSPSIVVPVGAGLDDKAVETVRRWKFDPGIREGKPVAVEMAVEVSFNLY